MRRLATLLCAILVAGCAAGELPYPPTLTIQLPENEFGKFALLVYDDTGLVVSGQSGEQVIGGVTQTDVTATPERNELTVSWTAGACSHQPWLRIKGDPSDLKLTIAPQPVEISLTPAISCPAIGIPTSVTLVLNEPVAQDDVSITENR